MRKRIPILLGGILAILLAGWLMLWMTRPPEHHINSDGFGKLRKGMTESEVEAVLGVPAGDYATGPIRLNVNVLGYIPDTYFVFRVAEKKWVGNEAIIEVWFENGRVEHTRIMGVFVRSESFPAKLRRWLGL